MKTYLECIPCFFNQALKAANTAGANDIKKKEILDEIAKIVPKFSLKASPPEMAQIVHRIVRTISGNKDPYRKAKEKSNKLTLAAKDKLRIKIENSNNRLLTAVELAIAGNIIDFGPKSDLDVDSEINRILNEEKQTIKKENKALFQFKEFEKALKKAKTILYLGDNVGETIFDSLLLEEIKQVFPEKDIKYVVRATPIINDALYEDAYKAGIDKYAEIINSGVDSPGTVLSLCSKEFLQKFKQADLIISKGLGNYEALSHEAGPIYFLFMTKCPVIAKHLNCNIGNVILKKGRGKIIL
ncbi:MAG: DUF89 family protein [Candidatus Margulisbacteria bacterium]|nr:DUF89 family protein [Candidatus Margulisiibacteriota bacterium]